jgi:predicted DNA-binding antitoxin AbrB/MazE fold protein
MALKIRAVYEDGQIKLLDSVELQEGQQLTISLEKQSERDVVRAALGDLIRPSNPDDNRDAWVEDLADEVAQELTKGRSLSEILIEERNSGW